MDTRTILIFAIIAAVFFAVQLFFCFIVKRVKLKFIPAYILGGLLILAGLIYTDVFSISGGFISLNKGIAALLAAGAGASLTGGAVAWAIYAIRGRLK